ncbi:TlpA family protein disulfide reductase [Candidatus Avelusimicrobium aviculae]|uniref:TlpA family protein disulfide reductase n=1 Tax=Candidatus Avelusimicrobium aviculae TaxID=3416206 RepID=UPI003D129DCF
MKKILLVTLCVLAGLNAQAKPAAKAKSPAAKPAQPVLSFSLPQVKTDRLLTSESLSGTPVLIAVVSSGCGYCQRTLPQLEAARRALPDVQIIAAFVDSTPKRPLALLNKNNLRLDAVYNAMPLAKSLKVDGVPMLFLFDAQHKLIKTFDGYDENRTEEIKQAAKGLEKEVRMISVEAK